MKQTVQHQRGSTQGHRTVVLTLNPTPVPARNRRVYVRVRRSVNKRSRNKTGCVGWNVSCTKGTKANTRSTSCWLTSILNSNKFRNASNSPRHSTKFRLSLFAEEPTMHAFRLASKSLAILAVLLTTNISFAQQGYKKPPK